MTAHLLGNWRRWAIAFLGFLLVWMNLLAYWASPDPLLTRTIESIIPLVLAGGLTGYGVWLARSPPPKIQLDSLVKWSVAGTAIIGLLGSWEMSIHLLKGETLAQTINEVSRTATVGAVVGVIIGLYDGRGNEEHREATRSQQAIAAAMDGIAVLNENGEYETMNQAHAEVYGYDDPDEFIGETWHMCYTAAEAKRIEQEVMPELAAAGSWRGQLVGIRKDGREFPQDITLSARSEGGLVCIVRDITARVEYETKLEALHNVTQTFLTAESVDAIAEQLVATANDILGYSLAVMWTYDAANDQLVPHTVSDRAREYIDHIGVDEFPTLESGSAEVAQFKQGTSAYIPQYETLDNRQNEDIPLGAVLMVPLGEYGMFSIGTEELDGISPSDQLLAEILGSSAQTAIEKLDREQTLVNREHRLSTIVENMPVILFAFDSEQTMTLQVGSALDRIGLEQNQMVGMDVEDAVGDSPAVTAAIEQSLNGEFVDTTIDLWGQTYHVWYQPLREDGEDGAVTSVLGVAMDVTERAKRELGIRLLHESTRNMIRETDPVKICQIAVETARNALELPVSGIWIKTDDQLQLEPVAWSEEAESMFDELPACKPGNSLVWQAYEDGELLHFDDVSNASKRFNSETKVRSELNVPIGKYGVINIGSLEPHAFDETDITLVELLVSNTLAALERADRERALQQQKEQMEFFNSILRHDVLNGMMVIRSRGEFLTEELTEDQLRFAETIVSWSDDVIDIVKRVRTVLNTLTGDEGVGFDTVDLSVALETEIERVQNTYPTVQFETDIPEGLSVRANELLGDVFGNVITNAVAHNETDGLCITVTAEKHAQTVSVRIADNGRGIPDEQKDTIFRRGESGRTHATNAGFGLYFVGSMVESYDGNVWIEDNTPQGAVFVIELPIPVTERTLRDHEQ
ncbi:GAF domain-containing protein [Haladaptatus sp. DJG-WS-42]|uniref:GAF domain-containing protein n=1 Tax=Haladaptatus sp. DJG-WS-42 TaxID=3120516 RepID=UPI0030CC09F0